MLPLKEIRRILSDRKWNLTTVSKESGLKYTRLYYALTPGSNPPYENVKILSDYLEKKAGE